MADRATPFPTADAELTHILVVADPVRSISWYRDVVGAELVREYGGTSAVFRFGVAWLLFVASSRPTDDKPDVTFEPPDPQEVSHAMTIRVEDCRDAYDALVARGAEFLTPPYDWGHEVRCFFRDPDGHLFEISQA